TDVFGVGTGLLALTLGMRHAFDADHISAIDNTTRSLMAERKRPLSVGFFFALGHSTVVFALAIALGIGMRVVDGQVQHGGSTLHHVTTLFGTLVSGAFLYAIAGLNVVILISIARAFVAMRRGIYDEAERDPEGFWSREAKTLEWRRQYTKVLDWSDAPFARWFVGGKLNVTESCLDRHLAQHGDRVAYYF
ncbi:acetyl-coenzyme A synthetase N-terminal domain-containing protein, partial [Metallibacterium scheffleri]|uniref:HoxN/HupN/NixA family nickel/cobalt transporter n=1 Tax=Metallibacterium scheffleri TaxID=993689 RepID=UPI0023F207AB